MENKLENSIQLGRGLCRNTGKLASRQTGKGDNDERGIQKILKEISKNSSFYEQKFRYCNTAGFSKSRSRREEWKQSDMPNNIELFYTIQDYCIHCQQESSHSICTNIGKCGQLVHVFQLIPQLTFNSANLINIIFKT